MIFTCESTWKHFLLLIPGRKVHLWSTACLTLKPKEIPREKIQQPRLLLVIHLRTSSETHLLHFLSNIEGWRWVWHIQCFPLPLSKVIIKKNCVYICVCVYLCVCNRKKNAYWLIPYIWPDLQNWYVKKDRKAWQCGLVSNLFLFWLTLKAANKKCKVPNSM